MFFCVRAEDFPQAEEGMSFLGADALLKENITGLRPSG